MKRARYLIIIALILTGVFAIGAFAFAQPNLGLNEFGAQTGLGTKPLGQTIAEIVRVFLGVLGTIAVILLLYAGFLWMTAAGEAEKIATAKKLIINAVIGLAIILASLAITQFIIGALSAATGTNIEAIGGGPGGGGGLPADAFTVKGISPQGNVPIRNVAVRIGLSHNPDVSTINGNVLVIKKSDNSLAPYTFVVNNNTIELTSSVGCPAPNTSVKCFDADTAYKVEVKTGLKDTGGKDLQCGGFAPKCTAEFTTGSLVDVTPPQVAITYPDPGQSVSQNSFVDVWAHAADDSAVSHIEFFADGAYFDKAFPPGASPPVFDGKVSWSTAAVIKGSHGLSAKAYDIDSNNTFSAPLNVIVRAEHCFNSAKDADETGVDCGGADCAVCSGGACTQNSDCASMSCQNGVCVDTPIILGVSPADGAPGTYVTIAGKYFGATAGTVTFLGGAGTGDDKVAQLAPCSGAWNDTQVVVVVPQGVTTNGPIEIKNSIGSDTTDNARGPVLPNFIISPTLRPGICSLTPTEGKSGTTFNISGTEFGASQGVNFIKFGNTYAVPQNWSNASIAALVPVLSAGDNSVQVNAGGVDSNAVTFKVLSLTSGTKPVINYVNPDKGPAGEYITLFGSNFGEAAGVVQFVRSDGTVALGDTNFPQVCAAINYWHNSYVTVKVPDKFSDGGSTKNITTSLRLRRFDNEISNVISFPINSDTPKPGICGLNPDNGPIGTPVDILGERFGAGGTAAFYNNVGATAVWGSEMIKTAVPNGAVSGPVKITVAAKDSNSVNFSIGDCSKTPGLCTVDQQCCAASCIPKTQTCQAAPKEGAYAWHISTGIIPRVPHVVEDCSTGDKAANPSPSPWDSRPGGDSVCVNGIVNIHFDSKLDPATVVMNGVAADTIVLYKCSGTSSTPCATKIKVALDSINSVIYSVNTTDDGIQLYPAGGNLEKDTRYIVLLTTKIRGAGAGGGYMEEKIECGAGNSYCFSFKTRNSDGLCKVGSLVTSPQDYTSDKKELLEYISSPRDKDDVCLNINALVYTYAWSSSQPGSAPIVSQGLNLKGQSKQNQAIVQTLFETTPGVPAVITSSIPSENVSGETNLTIKFADPEVVDKWPFCNTACVNSAIGASFNVDMDAATLIPANTEVWKCKTENCDSFDGLPIGGSIVYTPEDAENGVPSQFEFSPAAPLEISRYYLVRLDAQKIRSASGVSLTGGNPDGYYIWQFRTRADATPCTVNKVTVSPPSQIFNYIPQIVQFDSGALGAPDACNPQGQKLNSYAYGWTWKSADAAIVSLLNNGSYNVLPPAGVGCSDRCLRTGSKPGVSVCGNGKLEKGEDYDDNNVKNGDGCSDRCLAEGTSLLCGNGIKEKGETCDDGNKKSGDGCSDVCLAEGSKAGKSICGNGDIGKGETCDDGNSVSGDGCSNDCLNEGTNAGIASCGNGTAEKNLGEDCDDSNILDGDGCSEFCKNEGSIFAGSTSKCGNGLPEKGEDCDDGNIVSGDGCSSICLNEGSNLSYKPAGSICGDNLVEKGESCDSGSFDSCDNGKQCSTSADCAGIGGGECKPKVDPRQYGQAVSKGPPDSNGKTKINAATQNVSGSSDVEVLCIYTTDLQCQAFGADLGVGKDNCCYPRPQVKKKVPADGEEKVCRNTLVSATFDQLMDGATGEISIDQWKNGSPCPADSVLSKDGLWCAGAIKATRSVYDNVASSTTEFDWNISNLLESGKTYRVVLTDFKNKGGVVQATNPYWWKFTAGNDVCKVDQVKVTDNPTIFYNTKLSSKDNPYGSPRQAQALAISLPDNPLSSISGIYAWTWEWDTSPKKFISLSATAFPDKENISALGQNGEETLSAAAKITDDLYKKSPEKLIFGTARVIIFLCENPWPGLKTFPWTDASLNASTYYCRDTAPNLPLLPDLFAVGVAAPASADILKEYLFTNKATGDAVGLRVYQNLNHLSPLAWYKNKLFVGAPSASNVDGYEAIVDGRTTYINAANHIGPNYTNIFVVSYNQAAPAEIQNIYKQILDNWKFDTNLTNIGRCNVASGAACASDLDCAAGVTCLADKDKVRRDVKRLADLNDIAALLENYKANNNGLYPQILAGSFLRGTSVSVWPSWQAALGNDLGKGLPQDPLNKHAECKSPYDSTNCWDGAGGKYICPLGSHVYRYQNLGGTDYRLATDFEYFDKDWVSAPTSTVSIVNSCVAGAVFGTSSGCGDGVVGSAEVCELGQTKTAPCGTTNQFQKFTCSSDCKSWIAVGACSVGQCGDGIKQTNEVCDDGQNNGKYGYCNTSCGGLANSCGDGQINGSEQCDLGPSNGDYNANPAASCSWDCKKPGPGCGDKIVQSKEQCDGNSDTRKTEMTGEVAGAACANLIVDGVSYPTQNTRNCTASCTWDVWSGCKPAGTCGNGTKEGTEECDTASGTSGSCVMDTAKTPTPYACKTAVCGDGYVWTSKEVCDNGINNGRECVAAYSLTCNYCGKSCSVITKTGPYCGDKTKNLFSPEECDGTDFGVLSCKDFGFLEFTAGDLAGQTSLTCGQSCKANTSNCKTYLRVNAGGNTYTDSQGRIWLTDLSDSGYSGSWSVSQGGAWSTLESVDTGSTGAPEHILKSQHWSKFGEFSYKFNVAPGTYKVRLYFAEIWINNNNDLRIFDINVEGAPVVGKFDLVKEAGGLKKAIVKEFIANVKDSDLNITLTRSYSVDQDHICSGDYNVCTDDSSCAAGKKCVINNPPAIGGIEIESSSATGGQYGEVKNLSYTGGGGYTPPPPAPSCVLCTAGTTRCGTGGFFFQSCDTGVNNCTSWSADKSCPSGQSCTGGKCASCAVCTIGMKQCIGTGYQTCNAGGNGCTSWSAVSSCGPGQTCSGGTCVASCTNQCSFSGSQCTTGNYIETCSDTNSDGCKEYSKSSSYCTYGCSGGVCNPPPSCTPSCAGKSCGSDGCGGSCGGCSSGYYCNGSYCVASCTPSCAGKSCGSDGCGGSCGSCSSGYYCGGSGTCLLSCVPNCSGKSCGSDGCGGSCGSCSGQYVCNGSQCVCVPKTCADVGFVCGSLGDGCGGAMYCGGCPGGYSCWGTACCSTSNQACGTYTDSCGHTYQAGGCSSPYICVGTTCQLP